MTKKTLFTVINSRNNFYMKPLLFIHLPFTKISRCGLHKTFVPFFPVDLLKFSGLISV